MEETESKPPSSLDILANARKNRRPIAQDAEKHISESGSKEQIARKESPEHSQLGEGNRKQSTMSENDRNKDVVESFKAAKLFEESLKTTLEFYNTYLPVLANSDGLDQKDKKKVLEALELTKPTDCEVFENDSTTAVLKDVHQIAKKHLERQNQRCIDLEKQSKEANEDRNSAVKEAKDCRQREKYLQKGLKDYEDIVEKLRESINGHFEMIVGRKPNAQDEKLEVFGSKLRIFRMPSPCWFLSRLLR